MGSLSLGPDRDRVLDHAAHIVSRTWAEFDVARDFLAQVFDDGRRFAHVFNAAVGA